jgi:transcriptional regulator with XRE-family HTH domain
MSALGDELRRLRDERRITSQEKLSALSGVPEITIRKLESGATQEPRYSTLRLLAAGLARDFDGRPDPDLTETIYTRLMRAAGYLPKAPVNTEPGVSREAFLAEMEAKHGRRLALAMSRVAWDDDEIPDRYRKILETTILELAGVPEDAVNG